MTNALITLPKSAQMNGTTGPTGRRIFLRARPSDSIKFVGIPAAPPLARLPSNSQADARRMARSVSCQVAAMTDLPPFDPARAPGAVPATKRRNGLFLVPGPPPRPASKRGLPGLCARLKVRLRRRPSLVPVP